MQKLGAYFMAKSPKIKRWVVKAGSRMVLDGGALLIRSWMQQVYELRQRHNIEVIWVTSGAIGWASSRMNFRKADRTLPEKQALSAIGQPLVMEQYTLALQSMGLLGSQVLLTAGDMKDRVRRRNLQNTLSELLKWKAIPVLNENDAVATEEIRFGDNDHLASQVAIMMKAQKLILLTDVDGLYNADPKTNKKATLVSYLPKVSARDLQFANKAVKNGVGSGGMFSKLLAAQKAEREGLVTHFIRGDLPHNLLDLAKDKVLGSQIGGKL
jgi:glutamate 5-kinase